MPRWRLLNHWMQEKRPLERNDTVLCVYNNFIIHHTSLGKWQKGKQLVIVLICKNFVVLVNIIRCIFAIAHATMKCQNLFLIAQFRIKVYNFVATYVWLRANNALFMGVPSVSDQCNWFFMLHWPTSCVLRGPSDRVQMLIDQKRKIIILQFSFFNSKVPLIDLKFLFWWKMTNLY